LEKYKKFDDITSKDIIKMANNTKDPLCMKTVDKFVENFGTEAGNMALKTLPYGGIYLIGGVTNGLSDYLIHEQTFMQAFFNKGRLSDLMRQFPVLLVHKHLEVGILGAEEKARRLVSKM